MMMGQRKLLFALLACLALPLCAKNDVKTIEGTGEPVMVTDDMPMKQAKEMAIMKAKLNALSTEFGTNIELYESHELSLDKEKFYSMSFDNVKGEWLETIGEPKFQEEESNGFRFISCKIKGKARRKKVIDTDVAMNVLRGKPELSCKAAEFQHGNRMYVHFSTPVDGYVALFIHDPEADIVSCLLPYRKIGTGAMPVEHDKNYVFLSKDVENLDKPEERIHGRANIDECMMTCGDNGDETNTLYMVFSRHEFSKPTIQKGDRYKQDFLSFEDFFKWLTRCRTQDETFLTREKRISIHK